MKSVIFNNGVEVPILGFGTYHITDAAEAVHAVKVAIKAGYRHFDTANSYMNEEAVG
ncbi:2,5-diketo-D-gluconic acid reductase, partial [Listeria monocytogenes]|uniref:aldo/keto reductase n=1 Tax=Listeria monocytogenes TaxID=1639 RepID=UPI000D9D8A34